MGEKLTKAQVTVLRDAAARRPVGDNDDGWLSLSDCRRPTIWALVRMGILETRHKGPVTTGAQMHRITPAGRALLGEKK